MHFHSSRIAYSETGYFSAIVSAYTNDNRQLTPFYNYPVSVGGIKASMAARELYKTDRQLLVKVLSQQYKDVQLSSRQQHYLQLLNDDNTFTVCTAHQPNIFTGHLYFIYKILHAVKLAASLTEQIPGSNFVPVFYMGSEDADLQELGHIYLDGKKYEWKTDQKGAFGNMKVDKSLLQLIDAICGQLSVEEFGKEIIELLRSCYQPDVTIEQATFHLVNKLFAGYGLLILLPANRLLKESFIPVVQKELLEEFSHKAVRNAAETFPPSFKIQAAGREINLFYLTDSSRERIEKMNDKWQIINTEKIFSNEEMLHELNEYPERFSPNVILRPVYQEMILPNVAFIGGGGEIAYWLELKKVFEEAGVPYPVLIVRNSFLLEENKYAAVMKKLQFSPLDIFKPESLLMNTLVKRDSPLQLGLEEQKIKLKELYALMEDISGKVDPGLQRHTSALYAKALQKIEQLEKKIVRAEKKKFEAQHRQLNKLRQHLFPDNNLQERVENFMQYYAKWGSSFLQLIYDNSLSLEQEFVILSES